MKKFISYIFFLTLISCASSQSQNDHEKIISIPVTEADGNVRSIQTRLCIPEDNNKSRRLVILNHGSPPQGSDRPTVQGFKCDSEAVQWFLARGFIMASPIRRGYGATGGKWSESFGSCEHADFVKGGLETARDIQAAVEYLTKLPEIQPDHVVIVGQSAGGWGTIAYNSIAHDKVSVLINMAGGRGGHKDQTKNSNCSPEALINSAGEFGKTATTPMLWMYAENDSFFAPELARSMYEAFKKSGGKAEFIAAPAFGKDGHSEFPASGGSKVWGSPFEKYLSL